MSRAIGKSKHYDWTRYWLPRTEPLDLSSGFLPDPEDDFGRYSNPSLRPLASLSDSPVLVLLGDPGMGKTSTLEDEAARLRRAGMTVNHCRLDEYGSEVSLIAEVFESEAMRQWANGVGTLYLLLDSLDECTVEKADKALLRGLDKLPRDRLCLRITCRTADWPESLSEALRSRWESVSVVGEADGRGDFEYELVPLRKRDVADAARARGIDPDAFLDVVHDKDIETFASRPVSLRMLFDIWLADGRLPDQRAGIYERGCRLLAAENSNSRRESGEVGKLSAGQRMAIAGRIAAMMQLCGKSSIRRAGDESRVEQGELLIRELLGGKETEDGLEAIVDEKAIEETLGCGLCTGHGPLRTGFGHQSWQEFLAAWYLNRRLPDPSRLLALLQVGEDRRIAPKHAELVAWLAELSPTFFEAMVEHEPVFLLRGDIAGIAHDGKARLLAALLNGCKVHRFNPWDGGLRRHLHKLGQLGLEQIIRPWLVDASLDESVCGLALEIALACECQALSCDAADLVLDTQVPKTLRIKAVHVAALDDAQRLRLKPMALSADPDGGQDELHHELRAALLTRLWPEHLSTAELFDPISREQSLSCLGGFQYKSQRLVERFGPEDMLVALSWLERSGPGHDEFMKFDLADAICRHAWNRLSEPAVLSAFARVVRHGYLNFQSLFNRCGQRVTGEHPFEENADKRRLLIGEVLAQIADVDMEVPCLMNHVDKLVSIQDLGWLLERYASAVSERDKRILAKCLYQLFDWQNHVAAHFIIEAVNAEEYAAFHPLKDEMVSILGPILLGSPQHEVSLNLQKSRDELASKRRPPLDPPPAKRVTKALALCAEGQPLSWDRLWQELLLPDGATQYRIDYQPITDTPGWKRLHEDERVPVLQCARVWVFNYPLQDAEMHLGDGRLAYAHVATYLALCFLAELRPEWLKEADEPLWRRWLAAVVAYPYSHDRNKRVALLMSAHSACPDAVMEMLQTELAREIDAGETDLRVLDDLLPFWSDQVTDLIRGYLNSDIAPAQHKQLLTVLLNRQDETAVRIALGKLSQMSLDGTSGHESFELAQRLFVQAPRQAWDVLWSKTLANEAFGIALWKSIAGHFIFQFPMLKELDAASLADFYRWLEARFPEANDPLHLSGEHCSPTVLDDMAQLRSATVSTLATMASDAAVSSLEKLASEYPGKVWIRNKLVNARAARRNVAWTDIKPDQLLGYLERSEARFARNGDELMEAILESLGRLQTLLQGDNPLAPFLWNVAEDERSGRPKSEDRLSDFVLQHLRRDLPLVVIDREVQVDKPRETGVGRRIDIKAEARFDGLEPIVLVIETKGCWDKELESAMRDQLKDRYLRPLGARHGLLLVGWFDCDFWQGQNTKRRKCKALAADPGALMAYLEKLAGELSEGDSHLRGYVLDVRHPT